MSSDFTADVELELGELLQEFQDVVEELRAPSHSKPHAYQRILREAKSRTGQGEDSGVEDSDYSSEASLGNSLNTSEEELHTAGITLAPKAKLGDTRELESFIDMLDRELADCSSVGSDAIYQFDLWEHLPIVYPLITVFDWQHTEVRGQRVSQSPSLDTTGQDIYLNSSLKLEQTPRRADKIATTSFIGLCRTSVFDTMSSLSASYSVNTGEKGLSRRAVD
ncbi:hypothetical protein F2P81_007714 [Scophthalmus maximus]|uniref:Regulator of cell cycle RGCC-like n=1 Tax=Scophthalmus maximus TaxID=52904 RepID=A0A6A4T3M8_SCOMX|nr:hypothetical protein F2P81_007714 [Scophthalmus maximus]